MLIYLGEQLKAARMPRRSALLWLEENAKRRRAQEQPRLVRMLEKMEQRKLAQKVVDYFSTHPFDLRTFDPASGSFLAATAALPVAEPAAPKKDDPGPAEPAGGGLDG
jgi:hypothetical protein